MKSNMSMKMAMTSISSPTPFLSHSCLHHKLVFLNGSPPSLSIHHGRGSRIHAHTYVTETSVLERGSILDEVPYKTEWTTSHQQCTLPPLVAALKAAVEENPATFQFPGHNRGPAAPSSLIQLIGERPLAHDIGEIDDLFAPEGPILEAQKEAAKLFGASRTCFLVGGTTCGVLAAIMGTCGPGDTLVLPRNCHISAISALVLSGAKPSYIFPNYDSNWEVATSISPIEVEKAIKELELEGRKPAAVFITSPTYHGISSNVKEISTICHSRDIPLIVDEAHGAHFSLDPQFPISALRQGADVVVQSTHKVLLSLTQSSMLHMAGELVDKDNINRCLQALQSTSPSFLLLASLDATTALLKEDPTIVFANAIRLAKEAKTRLKHIPGISVLDYPFLSEFHDIDPLRVTVGVHDLGVSGHEANDFLLKDQNVLPVLVGSRSITFLFTPGTRKDDVNRLVLGFKNLSRSLLSYHRKKKQVNVDAAKPFVDIDIRLTPREAFFSKKKRVATKEALGKICGELICPYPPGIPVMIPGEVVSEEALAILFKAQADGAKVTGASVPLLSSIVICDV